ncbi:MAG: hypothetical protein ACLT1W_14275 [Alistipes onderdonkii]
MNRPGGLFVGQTHRRRQGIDAGTRRLGLLGRHLPRCSAPASRSGRTWICILNAVPGCSTTQSSFRDGVLSRRHRAGVQQQIIHPKTIKPLQNAGIPLRVLSATPRNRAASSAPKPRADRRTGADFARTKYWLPYDRDFSFAVSSSAASRHFVSPATGSNQFIQLGRQPEPVHRRFAPPVKLSSIRCKAISAWYTTKTWNCSLSGVTMESYRQYVEQALGVYLV